VEETGFVKLPNAIIARGMVTIPMVALTSGSRYKRLSEFMNNTIADKNNQKIIALLK
jgi:hypothetical protein